LRTANYVWFFIVVEVLEASYQQKFPIFASLLILEAALRSVNKRLLVLNSLTLEFNLLNFEAEQSVKLELML